MDTYNLDYSSPDNTSVCITNAPLDEAINYAVSLMSEHEQINVSKNDNQEIHLSGCDKLIITPALPKEYSLFVNNERYLEV